MSRKAILDRTYAYELINYLKQMTGDDENQYSNYEFKNVINWAAILYDKILIEDYYASSLFKLTRDEEWFWELFESYSPDRIISKDPELGLSIEESVEKDLKDKKLIRRIKKLNNGEYQNSDKIESLIWNINKTLLLAKNMNAYIIPAHHKMELLRSRNSGSNIFSEKSKSKNILNDIFELEVPYFEVDSLSNLQKIRKDKRVESLRDLIFKFIELDLENKEDILYQINLEKDEILKMYKPDTSKTVIKYIIGLFGPLATAAIESSDHTHDLMSLNKNGWRFLLIDLKNEK